MLGGAEVTVLSDGAAHGAQPKQREPCREKTMSSKKKPRHPQHGPQASRSAAACAAPTTASRDASSGPTPTRVKIRWDDGEQVTWRRDSLAGRPIEILDPTGEDEQVAAPVACEPSPPVGLPRTDPEAAAALKAAGKCALT